MSMRPPTGCEVRALAERFHFDLTDEEVERYAEMMADWLDSYDVLEKYEQPRGPGVTYERAGSTTDSEADDPHNAWLARCSIEGASDGPLKGWDVAIKDNVSVAGVEMTCGSEVVDGYVPDVDATIVSRLLDAGAHVVGKTNMDDMAFSGVGDTSAFGPTRNPHDLNRLAGGSSGGSAIVVATGQVDVAIGTDQGGSIRTPAAWSGVVGHKPTHGLVPYTGCIGIERTVDHVGPIAPTVRTAARTLSVVAGVDGYDSRQPAELPTEEYEPAIDDGADELSIAVVEEGFDRPGAEAAVNESVRRALDELESAGATVADVSLPMHTDAYDVYTVSLAEGTAAALEGEGLGHDWHGWWDVNWAEAFGRARRARGRDFPPGFKLTVLLGAYAGERSPASYARAMNLRTRFREAYDALLENHDLIAMPTTPSCAASYDPGVERGELARFDSPLTNTCAFNMTGHPSLSVPVTSANELPVGLMLTGKHFDDATVLAAGAAVEERASEQRR